MELLYQYLWKYRLFGSRLKLVDGRNIDIIHPGRLNTDAGPDFSDARLLVEGVRWAGNVEIHERASDWYRHGHDRDRAYDSVVLHVVGQADREVTVSDGVRLLPTVQVTVPAGFFMTYRELSEDRREVRCQSRLKELTELEVLDWTETLGIERLQTKGARIESYLRESNGDWDQAVFITLARALGFGLNALPFEMLAKSLPLNFLGRHADNPFQVEALMFGQAGLLDSTRHPFDRYYQSLCREYAFLRTKYSLKPLEGSVWKCARTRPGNFPWRRIALLARGFMDARSLLGAILIHADKPKYLANLFSWEYEGYWETHSSFGSEQNLRKSSGLTRKSVSLLLINMVAPLLYVYGMLHSDERLTNAALRLLDDLPAEDNAIIASWRSAGIECGCAMRSQALLHLRRQYCDAGRCLDCRFGYHLLKRNFQKQVIANS